MSYDVDAGPPRSVEVQRRLEEIVAAVAEWFTLGRWVMILGSGTVGHHLLTEGLPEASGATAAEPTLPAWVTALTVGDLAYYGVWFVAIYAVLLVTVVLHELCHWVAFQHYDVNAYWTLTWTEVGGREVYLLPPGGLCWPRHTLASAELSWREDAVVSLAPLALTAVASVPVLAYHVLVEPLSAVAALGLLLMTGPSPPDYASLLTTPRERWDTLVEVVEAQEPHRAAEGY